MNFKKLFEAQVALDEHIMEKHPELKGEYNVDWKLLALQVELGELANEWRGFKKWSNNQNPNKRDIKICEECNGKGWVEFYSHEECLVCNGLSWLEKNPLLEEYVDCLHFALSLGNELDVTPEYVYLLDPSKKDTLTHFSSLITSVGLMAIHGLDTQKRIYEGVLASLVRLGIKLGFTLEEIEAAYFSKNQVNHERQEGDY